MNDNKDTHLMPHNHEIDVVGLLKKVFKEPKQFCYFVAVSGVFGIIVALTTPKSYTSNAVLAPEISGSTSLSGNLSDIASSFGIDIGSGGGGMDAIYPEIYPEVIMSPDFLKDLMDVPVRLKKDDTPRTYYQHIKQDLSIALFDWPKVWIAKIQEAMTSEDVSGDSGADDEFKFSKQESKFCEMTGKCIACVVDKKTSIISISMVDQDPLVAAIMVDTIQRRLQAYITDYRTKKSRLDYEYFTKLQIEAENKYKEAQNRYAAYCDANKNTLLERYHVKRDALENDMQLTFQLMNQLTTQKEAAKAKIQETTPAFTVLSRSIMPHKASSTPRSIIVLLFILLGACADVVWVNFIRDSWRKWRSK